MFKDNKTKSLTRNYKLFVCRIQTLNDCLTTPKFLLNILCLNLKKVSSTFNFRTHNFAFWTAESQKVRCLIYNFEILLYYFFKFEKKVFENIEFKTPNFILTRQTVQILFVQLNCNFRAYNFTFGTLENCFHI